MQVPAETRKRRVAGLATTAVVLVLLAVPLATQAQSARRVYRIGLLSSTSKTPVMDAFREHLRVLGYIQGQNLGD